MTDPMTHSAAGAGRELIAFRIAEQEFCVDIMQVREIRGWTPATPLPRIERKPAGHKQLSLPQAVFGGGTGEERAREGAPRGPAEARPSRHAVV